MRRASAVLKAKATQSLVVSMRPCAVIACLAHTQQRTASQLVLYVMQANIKTRVGKRHANIATQATIARKDPQRPHRAQAVHSATQQAYKLWLNAKVC